MTVSVGGEPVPSKCELSSHHCRSLLVAPIPTLCVQISKVHEAYHPRPFYINVLVPRPIQPLLFP